MPRSMEIGGVLGGGQSKMVDWKGGMMAAETLFIG